MNQYTSGFETLAAEPIHNDLFTLSSEHLDPNMDFLYDSDVSNTDMSYDSDVDYTFTGADAAQPFQFTSNPVAQSQFAAPIAPMMGYGLPEEVQPMQAMPEQYPEGADYDPEIGWYETTEPFAQGASFKRRLGIWFRAIAATEPSSAAPSLGVVSGYSTPISTYEPFAALPGPSIPQVSIPQPKYNKLDAPSNITSMPRDVDMATEGSKKPSPQRKVAVIPCTCEKAARIPRPPNAFMLYRSAFLKNAKTTNTSQNQPNTSVAAGEKWHTESAEVRDHYQDLANKARAEHRKKYPDYKYSPQKCTCGAKQSRKAQKVDQIQRGVEDLTLDDFQPHRQGKRQRRGTLKPSLQGTEEPDELTQTMPDFGLPAAQQAQAAKIWAANQSALKRKHAEPSPALPSRRSTRATRNAQASYIEPTEDDEDTIVVAQPSKKSAPAPINTTLQADVPSLNTRSSTKSFFHYDPLQLVDDVNNPIDESIVATPRARRTRRHDLGIDMRTSPPKAAKEYQDRKGKWYVVVGAEEDWPDWAIAERIVKKKA